MNKKDMILGLKFNTFEKHARKMKMVSDVPHLGKKQGKFYVNKKCNHVKIKVIYFQHSHMKIVEQVIYEGLKGERRKKNNNLPQIFICYYRANLCLTLKLGSHYSFFNVPMNPKNQQSVYSN